MKPRLEDIALELVEKLGQGSEKLKTLCLRLKEALATESVETRNMLEIYKKYQRGAATKEELAKANKQLGELIKTLGLGVMVVLPFSPITIPLIAQLEEKLSINIFPTSFKKSSKDTPDA